MYIVLIASKKDTSNKHWKEFKLYDNAKEYQDSWPRDKFYTFVYELGKLV